MNSDGLLNLICYSFIGKCVVSVHTGYDTGLLLAGSLPVCFREKLPPEEGFTKLYPFQFVEDSNHIWS